MDIKNNKYYEIAGLASSTIDYPADYYIRKYGSVAKKILDLGCGEGTRLNLIPNSKAVKIGVDVSKLAINLCRKKYPKIISKVVSSKLPFKDNSFDFVYSAFVLEHTKQPEIFLGEAVRVLSKDGTIILVAPNFGSPNRQSPNGISNRYKKLITGFANDIRYLFLNKIDDLEWQKVKPQKTYLEIDADTTIEPYLLSLEKYISALGIRMVLLDSLWSQERSGVGIQLIFKVLSKLNIPPFTYWGPHLLYIGKKYD